MLRAFSSSTPLILPCAWQIAMAVVTPAQKAKSLLWNGMAEAFIAFYQLLTPGPELACGE